MPQPQGYITRSDCRAEADRLIADYLANGGSVTVYPLGRRAL